MKRFDSMQGKTQADPPIGENRLRECQWEPSGGISRFLMTGSAASISANSQPVKEGAAELRHLYCA